VDAPDWPDIRRVANELSAATVNVRQSLIQNEYEAGELIPVRAKCITFCLTLNEVLELPINAVDAEMRTTVANAMDAAMDLKGGLSLLIDISKELVRQPGVNDRVALQEEWKRRSEITYKSSLDDARLLDALVDAIDLQTSGAQSGADVEADHPPGQQVGGDLATGADGAA
jgi:hypothetical protein